MIITASIVTYKTDHDELKKCIDSMRKNGIAPIYISDNSPRDELRDFCSQLDGVEYIFNNANMGYGPGHNVAIKKAQEIHADYHLVINSDVYFEEYIKSLTTKTFEELSRETLEIIKKIGSTEFLDKISFYEEKLNWNEKKCLINVIADLQDHFEGMKGGAFMFGFHNPRKEAAKFITRMLQSQSDENEKFLLAQSLLRMNIAFDFSRELMWWFK